MSMVQHRLFRKSSFTRKSVSYSLDDSEAHVKRGEARNAF